MSDVTPATDKEINQYKLLDREAPQSPWQLQVGKPGKEVYDAGGSKVATCSNHAVAFAVAEARTAIPKLIARVEREKFDRESLDDDVASCIAFLCRKLGINNHPHGDLGTFERAVVARFEMERARAETAEAELARLKGGRVAFSQEYVNGLCDVFTSTLASYDKHISQLTAELTTQLEQAEQSAIECVEVAKAGDTLKRDLLRDVANEWTLANYQETDRPDIRVWKVLVRDRWPALALLMDTVSLTDAKLDLGIPVDVVDWKAKYQKQLKHSKQMMDQGRALAQKLRKQNQALRRALSSNQVDAKAIKQELPKLREEITGLMTRLQTAEVAAVQQPANEQHIDFGKFRVRFELDGECGPDEWAGVVRGLRKHPKFLVALSEANRKLADANVLAGSYHKAMLEALYRRNELQGELDDTREAHHTEWKRAQTISAAAELLRERVMVHAFSMVFNGKTGGITGGVFAVARRPRTTT